MSFRLQRTDSVDSDDSDFDDTRVRPVGDHVLFRHYCGRSHVLYLNHATMHFPGMTVVDDASGKTICKRCGGVWPYVYFPPCCGE